LLLRAVAPARDPQACDQIIANQLELPELQEAGASTRRDRLERLFELAQNRAQLAFERCDLAA
jgi:hypothetical protein